MTAVDSLAAPGASSKAASPPTAATPRQELRRAPAAQGPRRLPEEDRRGSHRTVMAAKDIDHGGDRAKLVGEVADLWFHSMIALAHYGLKPADVIAELERREGTSGIEEKALRKARDARRQRRFLIRLTVTGADRCETDLALRGKTPTTAPSCTCCTACTRWRWFSCGRCRGDRADRQLHQARRRADALYARPPQLHDPHLLVDGCCGWCCCRRCGCCSSAAGFVAWRRRALVPVPLHARLDALQRQSPTMTDQAMNRPELHLLQDRRGQDPLAQGLRGRRDLRLPRHPSVGAGALPAHPQAAHHVHGARGPRARRPAGPMMALVPKLAMQEGCRPYPEGGFRMVTNTGAEGGQEVRTCISTSSAARARG
jgi:phosphoribosyl-ATP pyrophosphohydrolase